jgi:hypothetical protein
MKTMAWSIPKETDSDVAILHGYGSKLYSILVDSIYHYQEDST